MRPFAPSWHWKDWTIAALAAALVIVGGLWLAQTLELGTGEAAPGGEGADDGAEAVSVFDVVLDREGRKYVDILFDRPVAKDRAGEILGLPPATVQPPLAGVWRWREEQVLRFEPSGGFPVASRYELALIPERFLGPDQTLAGESAFELETDRFLLEQVSVEEIPSPLGGGRVTLHGQLQFNYAVDPRQLAPLVKLIDPLAGPDAPIEVELEDVYWSRPVIAFRTGEVEKQKAARTLELVVDGALTPAAGNAPLGEDAVQEIPLGSRDRLAVREVVGNPGLDESTVRVELSSRVDPRLAGKYLRITPETKYRASAQGNTLTLTGAFRPGGRYALALAAGLPAEDGATLPEAYETTVTLSDLPPSLDFESQGSFLAASGERNVAVQSVNVDRFQLAIDRAYANNLFFLFDYQDLLGSDSAYSGSTLQHTFGDRIVDETVRVGADRNTQATTVLPIGRYLAEYWQEHGEGSGAPQQPGLYRVLVTRPGQWQASQRWLLLTDLGAVVKQAPGEVLAWVSSVRTLAPAGGARVTLISDQNQTIAQGRTDADGFWRFRDTARLAENRPYLVKVEKGEDFTFVALDRMGIDTTGLEVGGAPSATDGYAAYLYGERDLYRPGETAEGMAIVRDGALRPAPAMPALLRHRDPRGLEVETQTVKIDDRGLAPFQLELPPYALTGNHTLELEVGERVIGRYRFQVEEFIPDRIKVEIAPGDEPAGPGEDLAFDVASSYLFGPPAASLPVEARVRLVPADFRPTGFEGFSFRNDERKLDAREILNAEGTLDETGHHAFAASIPAGLEPPSSLQAVITARVSEQGGRGVAARTSVPVHPYPYYLGIRRTGQGSPEPGQKVELEYVAVTPDGEATPARVLRAELYFVRWHTVLRKTPSGGYKYETVREPMLVADQTLPAGKPEGSFHFTPTDYGSHRVVITDPASGASAAVDFWASGWGYAPWAMENPSRIELELDKDEYAPGETATVQVRAPFAGRLLVTVERDQIFHTRVYDLAENTATVQIPIRRELRPNAYVTATLVRKVGDLEPGSVGRAFGAVPLSVDRTANRQAVTIEAPDQVRSESKLEVTARAAPGSVVTVAAVDEGILQLIAQKTPDPFELFYRKLALGVRSFDTFSLLLPEVAVEGAAQAGGGFAPEGAPQYVRTEGIRRVEPVAFWSGPVVADGSGRAVVRFDLPELQGALRLMAVAVKNETMGSAERQTRVRDPLVLLPTLPRILSFDETLRVPVTVRNDSGRSGPVQVTMELAGPAEIESARTVSIPLDDGSEGTVYFAVRTAPISAQAAGELVFTFRVEGLGERGKASGRVGLRPDLPSEASEQAGSLAQASLDLPLEPPTELRPETVRREVRVGALPLVQLAGKLDALVRYPYGCLEQTVSQAFPQIYLADIIQAVDPELLNPDRRGSRGQNGQPLDPKANVAEALRRVAGLQLADGGFSLWPGWDDPHPWTSVYAAHFLVEAERAGYPVASHVRQRALDFLGTQVRAKSSYGTTELARTAYALYVLARAGQADLGTMDFLRTKHLTELEPQSKALLAAAYAAVGRRDTVGELVARIGEVERVERQTGEVFDSTVRNRALLLMALLDAAPESPRVPALADRLARDAVTDPWWTTQETGFTLLALGQLYHRQAERPPYRGKVYLGDRLLGAVSSDAPAHFTGLRGDGPVRIVMDPGYQAGAAFYSVITRGIPTDEDFRPTSAGLEIERTYLTRDGSAADLGQVRQGDLLVIRTRIRSVAGAVQNVVIQNLLPSGIEVENPRLETTETLPWATPSSLGQSHLDLRDDRILLFTDLPANQWQTVYALVRAVSPGSFRVPPAHAEAMYNPALRATGQRDRLEVNLRESP